MSFDSISRRFGGKTTDKPVVPLELNRTVYPDAKPYDGPNPYANAEQTEFERQQWAGLQDACERSKAQSDAWQAKHFHAADGAAWPEPEADGPQSVADALIRLEALLEERHRGD